MNSNHEVISAFLDDEPFEPEALAEALADPAGRALLIDVVLLRHMAQSSDSPSVHAPALVTHSQSRLYLVAAAAVIIALLGGYQLGHMRSVDDSTQPPAATRTVQSEPVWRTLQ